MNCTLKMNVKLKFILLVCFITFYGLNYINAQGIKDDTQLLQSKINNLRENGILDGEGKSYHVTSLWLKSNITIQNMKLISIPTKISDVSVINIGNDLETNVYNKSKEANYNLETSRYSPGLINITIENITIDGQRENQEDLEIRDGGKHGINIKGFASNIIIRNVIINNCATDGIAIYRGLHTDLVKPRELFAAKNIIIDNAVVSNNRRHGGSGDSIDGLLIKNSTFNNNGQTYGENTQKEGLKGAIYNGKLYGNGWDMEGYGLGSGIKNIEIRDSQFVNNMGGGIVFYDVADSNQEGFVQRSNILIENCTLDAGYKNPSGFFALVFSSTIETKTNTRKLFSNIKIKNSLLVGKLLLRSVDGLTLENTRIDKKNEMLHGLMDNVSNISTKNKKYSFLWYKYDYFNVN